MKLEIDIEEEVCAKALEMGVTNVKMKFAGVVGYPDRQFFIPGGRPLFIEFKRPGEPLRAGQKIIIRRLRYYGYQVEICDDVQPALQYIQRALDAACLSTESNEILVRARRSGAPIRSGARKNEYMLRRVQSSKK